MIIGISQVIVSVDDQEHAKEFWTTVMGMSPRPADKPRR
jgi:catechol 2,3-dioxygenase-like lactoylglutathione lyase family enzyme